MQHRLFLNTFPVQVNFHCQMSTIVSIRNADRDKSSTVEVRYVLVKCEILFMLIDNQYEHLTVLLTSTIHLFEPFCCFSSTLSFYIERNHRFGFVPLCYCIAIHRIFSIFNSQKCHKIHL